MVCYCQDGKNCIELAASYGHNDIVTLFTNASHKEIWDAAYTNDHKFLTTQLAYGGELNWVNEEMQGRTSLMAAVAMDNYECVQMLIKVQYKLHVTLVLSI